MIRIVKGKPPRILTDKGQKLIDEMKLAFAQGERSFQFDSTVWKAVKKNLMVAQYNKCCFCESSLHAQHGDVEHLRPKGGWKQNDNDTLSEVGYYWLAYDWENLFLACQQCNQTFKKNFFPLENPADRAFNHTYDITTESHLIINPATDFPENHLIFIEQYAKGKTPKGRETIKRTAIGEKLFEEDRERTFRYVKLLILGLKMFEENQIKSPTGEEYIAGIKKLVSPTMPYYAMLRDNFKTELLNFDIQIP